MGTIVNCASPIGSPQHGRLTILVVEDDILLRMTVTDELRKQGFNVAEAANTDEALSIIQSGVPVNLVLTEIDMTGTQASANLAGTIRTDYPDMRLVIASGHPIETQFDHEVDGFFQKPYDVSKVVDFIKALLVQ
jgi:DNA-binding NtrC family response regulator